VLARVLLAEQRPAAALRLLARLHAMAATQGRVGSVIQVRTLQALALQAVGDHPGALAALAEALTLAWPEGYVRVFVEQGASLAALLHQLAKDPTAGRAVAAAHLPGPYLDRLLDAFRKVGLPVVPSPSHGGAAVPGLVMPLTSRELEVLRLLAPAAPTRRSPRSSSSPWTRSNATSPTSSTSSAPPTAPRPSPGPGSCDCCPRSC
jgi:LuxR family maltose regulon positive regulatory protein